MLNSSKYILYIRTSSKELAKGVVTISKNILRSIIIVGALCGVIAVWPILQGTNPQTDELPSGSGQQSEIINETHMQYDENGILKPEYAKPLIKETADKLLYALSVNDAESISADVHPAKGLRFTPYTYVSLEDDVVFNASEVKNFFNNQEQYLWGHYDGIGDDIFLTPGEYFDKFVYPEDYLKAEEIGYNEVLSYGNMLENQFEVYEDAIVVEYYFSGFNPEYAGMDWRSLRLVFQEYEGSWKLVGLINNQWTI